MEVQRGRLAAVAVSHHAYRQRLAFDLNFTRAVLVLALKHQLMHPDSADSSRRSFASASPKSIASVTEVVEG